MFTGIVTDMGTVEGLSELAEGRRFRVATAYDVPTIDIGASIAHDGVCLTVVAKGDATYDVEAWEEALRLTTAGAWGESTKLNLERALKVGDELGGHIVAGHVDGMAEIIAVEEEGDATRFRLRAPNGLAKFIAPKGSVALNGTSLTVNDVQDSEFDVLIIRHTLEVTTWGERRAGDRMNIEIDTMARYAERILSFRD